MREPLIGTRVLYDRGFCPGVSDLVVAFVSRLTLNIALRGELLLPLYFDGKMNMRRASRVGHRLDGAEHILAG